MTEIVSYVPAELERIREETELVDELVSSGAITEAERQQLLDQFLAEHHVDRESRARRARFAPTYDLHIGEHIMNANDIVTQIAHTHNVMSAQVRKLNELSPKPTSMTGAETGTTSGLADLLQATIAGHISNATESLRAIAEVEAAMCAPVSKATVTVTNSTLGSSQIIDAEVGEVV